MARGALPSATTCSSSQTQSSTILYRMKATSALLSLAALLATAASASDVLDLTSSTFNDAVAGPLALVEFFAPWLVPSSYSNIPLPTTDYAVSNNHLQPAKVALF